MKIKFFLFFLIFFSITSFADDCDGLDLEYLPELSLQQIEDFLANEGTDTIHFNCLELTKISEPKHLFTKDNKVIRGKQYAVYLKTTKEIQEGSIKYQEIQFKCGKHTIEEESALKDSYLMLSKILKNTKIYRIYIKGGADLGGDGCPIDQDLPTSIVQIPFIKKIKNTPNSPISRYDIKMTSNRSVVYIEKDKIKNSSLPWLRANYIYTGLKNYLIEDRKKVKVEILESTITRWSDPKDRKAILLLFVPQESM